MLTRALTRLGKALSVWVAPVALRTSADGSEVVLNRDPDGRHYRRVQAVAAGISFSAFL